MPYWALRRIVTLNADFINRYFVWNTTQVSVSQRHVSEKKSSALNQNEFAICRKTEMLDVGGCRFIIIIP